MKKLFLISLLVSVGILQSLAFDYTDERGVTWSCREIGTTSARITSASGYGDEVVIPEKVYDGTKEYTVTYIQFTFQDNKTLEKVTWPSTVMMIPGSMFQNCSSLKTVENIKKVTSIGSSAFNGCNSLMALDLGLCSIQDVAFRDCSKLQSIGESAKCTSVGSIAFECCSSLQKIDLSMCTSVGSYAFNNCSKLQSIGNPTLTSIPDIAFSGCSSLENIDLSMCTSVGSSAFSGCSKLQNVNTSICTYIGDNAFNRCSSITEVDLSACKNLGSSVFCGCTKLEKVIGLENIKSIPSSAFSETGIKSVDLPVCTTVAFSAFKGCSDLQSVNLPACTTIYFSAFRGCIKLDNVILPDGLESIGSYYYSYSWSFSGCNNLKTIQFPPSLKYIGSYAFSGCYSLEKISLPGLDRIDENAFSSCTSLKEVRIPSTLQNIGNGAFYGCSSLADIYTYTVEPISIGQNTFDEMAYKSARLWMPTQSYANYYYQTQWGQFDNDNYRWFDEPYKYMYINKDYTLSDANSASKDKGRFDGNPDIDVNPGGGLIVDGDKDQTADDIHLKADASNWATIIAKANVDAKRIFIDITIEANRWHFFCFPFDIKRSNIKCDGNFVFRYYDGKIRAEKGKGGWTDLPATEEYLKAGKGYIFQASTSCTLSIMIEKEKFGKLPNVRFDCNLEANASTNEQDASWNFVGNPFTSFFDLNDMGYNAPVTRWNGSGYEAVRPGDDDYIFHPYEAFFVQRPTGSSSIEFDPEHRMTQIGSNNRKTENAKKALKRQLNPERQLVNLAITDGKNTDKTRVVFNQTKSNKYEMDCDAAKFESTTSAVQLYSIEAQGGKMAINERPQGSVQLGFTAKADGDYTISAERMDQPVLLKDNLMNITYDLSNGDYSFSSEAGTFDNRFMLLIDGGATGIADIAKEAGVNIMPSTNGINLTGVDGKTVNVYSLSGALFATRTENGFLNLSKGVYIVEVGKMKAKVMVK